MNAVHKKYKKQNFYYHPWDEFISPYFAERGEKKAPDGIRRFEALSRFFFGLDGVRRDGRFVCGIGHVIEFGDDAFDAEFFGEED